MSTRVPSDAERTFAKLMSHAIGIARFELGFTKEEFVDFISNNWDREDALTDPSEPN